LYSIISKSKNCQSSAFKNALSLPVLLCLAVVNVAIHFDHQPCLSAIEVDNETINGVLTSPTSPIQLTIPQR
jgi:hypothetical protein